MGPLNPAVASPDSPPSSSTVRPVASVTSERTEARGVRTAAPDERRRVRWGLPLLVYALSRLVDTWFLVEGAGRQIRLTSENFSFFVLRDFPAHPSYLDVIRTWDGQFYEALAERGYVVPAAGDPLAAGLEFTWTFPPVFPMAVRAGMWLTGGSFPVVATFLNLAVGALAMVLLHGLVRRTADRWLAVAVVATTSFFVSAPLLQTAYSESMALLLLVLVLRGISSRRWGWAIAGTVLLAFTRIVTPPVAAVALVHLWLRRRGGEAVPRREQLLAATLAVVSLIGPFAWSWTVGAVRPGNMGAERATNTIAEATTWLGQAWAHGGLVGLLLVGALAVTLLLLPFTRTGQALGPELSTWLWAYPAMLLVATPIQPGMLRYLLLAPGLLVPLLGPFREAGRVARWVALGVLVVLLVLTQWWFVDALVVVDSTRQRFGP